MKFLRLFLLAATLFLYAPAHDDIAGVSTYGAEAITENSYYIMQRQKKTKSSRHRHIRVIKQRNPLKEGRKDRRLLQQHPDAVEVAELPLSRDYDKSELLRKPQKVHSTFTAVTLDDSDSFPPDSMGDVGPTQYIAFTNGRIRSFNKKTKKADGVLNVDPDVFFASI